MADRSVTVVLRANINDFKARMREAEQAVDRYGKNADGTARRADTALGRMAQSAQNNRQAWDQAGAALVGFGAATVGGLGLAVKAAIDWESAFAGVRKTTDVSGLSAAQAEKAFAGLEDGLRAMARTLPASQAEIAGVAEAAGQLGVKRDAVLGFTRTMIDLGETTNLTAEEAATSLARISNIMGTSADDVSRMGSTIVELGNNSATTEAEIVELATRLAAAGRQAGLSESDVFAFASTLTSVGVEAEAGGTALSKVFTSISDSVRDGGEKLDTFARVAGVSAAQFQQAYGEDAAGAVAMFVNGLGEMSAQGESTTAVFEELELTDQRLMRALLSTGSAQGLLTDQLEMANGAWSANTALANEAAQRYETTAAQVDIAKNNIRDAAITLGETFLPAVGAAAEGVAGFAQGIASLPEPVQKVGGGLAAVAGGASLLGGAFLLTFPRVMDTVSAFRDLRDISPGAASGLANVGKAAGAATIALTAANAAYNLVEGSGNAMVQSASEAALALSEVGLTAEDVDAQIRSLKEANNDAGFDNLQAGLESLTDPSLMARMQDFTREVFSLGSSEGRSARDDLIKQLESTGQALATLVTSGNADLAAQQFDIYATAAKAAGMTTEELLDLMPPYRDALADAEVQQRLLGESSGAAVEGLDAVGDAAEATGEQMSASQQRIQDWRDEMIGTVEAFVDPLGVYNELLAKKEEAEREAAQTTADTTKDSSDSWEDHVGDVDVSLKEYAENLAEQNERQERWRDNLVKITDRGGVEVARILADMGAEGAHLTDKMANATSSDFERMKNELVRDARFGRQGVVNEIAIMERLGRAGAKDTAEGIAQELGVGADEVRRIAARYSVNLAEGVNPLLSALGRQRVAVSRAQRNYASGRSSAGYAEGGFEDHTAQIAQGQTPFRVWAEPETGGEAYIPLAPAKRSRSLSIWEETGRRLGVQGFASGGFSSASDVPKPPGTGKYRAPISTAGAATMDHAYDETTEWVDANSLFGGIGSAGGAGGRGWQWQMAVLRRVFPGLPLYSGYRPGAITALGNRSMHGMGRAVDVPPRSDVFNWIKSNFGASTKQLFFSPMGALLNGRPWNMDPVTRRGHWDHIHWGYRDGGIFDPGSILNPHVRDNGGPLLPGLTWNGTGRAETVVPNQQAQAPIHASVRVFVGDRELTDMVRVEVDQVSASARDRFQYAGTT